jgi:CheY-like chemotaxis protein
MRILAVDDDPDFLELFQETLEKLGYTDVTTALSGARAVELIEDGQFEFDCLILDIKMPEMSGIELCKIIRANPAYADVPIVMNTVMTEKAYIDEAFSAGATDYLTKPIDEVETKSRLGVIKMLVQERARAALAPQVRSGQTSSVASMGFHDSIPMKRIDGGTDVLAMENYLNTLGIFRALSVLAIGVHVSNAREIYDMEGGSMFREVMLDVATCISDALPFSAKMIAYRGGGEFVCLLPKNRERECIALEEMLLSFVTEFQRIYDEIDMRLPVISVGNAVSCRATNITNPTRLINEAIRSAKEITLEEPRFG